MVSLKSREIRPQMIFTAARPVLESELIFDCNHQTSLWLVMAVTDFHKILIGRCPANIRLPILKNPDQQHIVIILVEMRLNILKIADHDRDIVHVTVAVGIHQAALSRQIHTGDTARPPCKRACDCAAACTDLKNFICLFEGQPVDDIRPQR